MEIRFFLTYLHGGQLSPRPYTLPPAKAIYLQPSQKFFAQGTKMKFDLTQAHITGPVVRGLYCPSLKIR